jgi:hypothetical protein
LTVGRGARGGRVAKSLLVVSCVVTFQAPDPKSTAALLSGCSHSRCSSEMAGGAAALPPALALGSPITIT